MYVHKEYTSFVYNHLINSEMKGSIKMKKHYIRLTAVITVLILAVFIVLVGSYTYMTATKIMNDKMANAMSEVNANSGKVSNIINDAQPTDDSDPKKDLYWFLERHYFFKEDNEGYYGTVLLDDGSRIESGDFIKVDAVPHAESDGIETRYIPVGSDFKSENRFLWEIEIDAMCDDTLIFGGKIKYNPSSDHELVEYTIPENKSASAENAVSVSEWSKGKRLDAEYFAMADTRYEAKLNKEAKEKLDDVLNKQEKGYVLKIYTDTDLFYYTYQVDSSKGDPTQQMDEKIKKGQVVNFSQYKLGTSYYIYEAVMNSDAADKYMIYLFHPIEVAVREHLFLYIFSLISLIVLEAFTVAMMRKMYSNRMSYELMRQDLTRSIAHDLKTPLAVTKAYTENWEYIDEEDRHEYAEKLNAEVDHMSSLINNMLSMSKLDSEKDIRLEEVELYAVTSAVYERVKPIIAERNLNVKLITDVIGGEYFVYADPKMIKIAVSNFITNAVKYAESRIEIKLMSKDKKVIFMVTNDGKCISKKDLKRIWEPFYKGDKARTDRLGSSGMGLAINSSILQLHKAKYKCISSNNETSFWFELKKVGKNGK